MKKSKINFRARVMKYAWELWKATGETWRGCMLKAWQLWRLIKAMMEGAASFVYRKVDGTYRTAFGTLHQLPEDAVKGSRRTKMPYKTIVYFDIEKNAFRSFRIENYVGLR